MYYAYYAVRCLEYSGLRVMLSCWNILIFQSKVRTADPWLCLELPSDQNPAILGRQMATTLTKQAPQPTPTVSMETRSKLSAYFPKLI